MDQTLRASIQTSTFYYFMIVIVLTTISQLSTMMGYCLCGYRGKRERRCRFSHWALFAWSFWDNTFAYKYDTLNQ